MFRLCYFLAWPILMLLLGVRGHHRERIPRGRGFLICANHTSMLDVVVLYGVFFRRIRFMAKSEIFRTAVGNRFFRMLGAFPVHRGGADVTAIRTATELIESGNPVCLFPQGTRRPGVNPRETPVRGGAGMIAYRTGADVLPIYIKTKGNKVRWLRRTDIIVGEPIPNGELGFTAGTVREFNEASALIFDRICSLGEAAEKAEEGKPES